MNCVIYSRVSTNAQDNKRQINELKAFAKQQNLDVLEVFDEKITGASEAFGREAFKKLKDFIEKNQVDCLLIWELSRLGRKMIDVINTVEYFSDKKINIYIKIHNLWTLDDNLNRTSSSKILISILSVHDEERRRETKLQSISGIREKVAQGGVGTGSLKAYGYKAEDKKLIVDDEEAKIVKIIFKKYLGGLGTGQIAKYLNNKSIPTRYNKFFQDKSVKTKFGNVKKGVHFKWRDGTIYGILTNSIYKGERRHKKETFSIEPIISQKDFDTVQKKLSSNFNKKNTNRLYQNVLKEKIICPRCGLTYFMHKRANKRDNAYKCLSKRYNEYCGNPSVNIDKLNNAVYPYLKKEILFGAKLNKSKEQEIIEKQLENKEIEIQNTIDDIDSTNSKISNLIDIRLTIEDKFFTTKYNALISDNKRFSEKLVKLEQEKEDLIILKDKVINVENLDLENPSIFKKYASDYIEYIKVHEIKDLGHLKSEFTNRQDKAVLIELKTLLNSLIWYFIISQRTDKVLLVNLDKDEDFRESIINGELDYFSTNLKYDIKV